MHTIRFIIRNVTGDPVNCVYIFITRIIWKKEGKML